MQKKYSIIIIILLAIIAVALVVSLLKKPTGDVSMRDTFVTEPQSAPTTSVTTTSTSTTETVPKPGTYVYTSNGFSIELPEGYTPSEITGETGPTLSFELPTGWLIYVSDADWWEQNNLVGQAIYLRDQKIGETVFKVYRYSGSSDGSEFYWFRQGNVAYLFNGTDIEEFMETFRFVGWN